MKNNQAIITRLTNLSTKIYNICQNKIYIPVACVLCDKYNSNYQTICDNCYSLLTPLNNGCSQCRKPLTSISQKLCPNCQQNPPAFAKVYTAFQYEEPLKMLIHNFKYHRNLYLTSFLTELMLKAPVQPAELGLIIPAPLSKKSMQTRGYNQAAILAKAIAKKLKVPYEDNYLQKIINTPNQVAISGVQRRNNLNNAFTCNKSNYQTITVVDDILTTGSTAHAMANTLKASGVEQVNIWCCART